MPRRYRMDRRAAAVEETRRQIVAAGKTLQAEQSILGTSYEEIAHRAGTSVATVYRHFPSLDDLLPACARSIPVLRPLTPEQAAATFHGMRRLSQRLAALVHGTCDCYAHDQGWLQAAHGERLRQPVLREMVQVGHDNLRLLVQTALADTAANERAVRVIAALLDFPVWQALRDAGLSQAETAAHILELVRDQLVKEGIL